MHTSRSLHFGPGAWDRSQPPELFWGATCPRIYYGHSFCTLHVYCTLVPRHGTDCGPLNYFGVPRMPAFPMAIHVALPLLFIVTTLRLSHFGPEALDRSRPSELFWGETCSHIYNGYSFCTLRGYCTLAPRHWTDCGPLNYFGVPRKSAFPMVIHVALP